MSRIFPDTHQPSAFRLVLSSFCSSKKKKKKTFEDIIFHIGYDKDCGLQKAFKYTICEAPETPIGTIMAGLAGDKCGEVMDSCMENQRDPIHTNTQMTPGHSTWERILNTNTAEQAQFHSFHFSYGETKYCPPLSL